MAKIYIELFEEKIKQLRDDKLKASFQLKDKHNALIMALAEKRSFAGTLMLAR